MFESVNNAPPDPLYTFRGHTGKVTALTFFKNTLVSGSDCGELIQWDLTQSKRMLTNWTSQDNKSITWIGTYRDNIISQGRNGHVNVWKEENSKQPKNLPFQENSVWILHGTLSCNENSFCSGSALENLLAVPGTDSDINIFDLDALELRHNIKSSRSPVKHGLVICCKLIKGPPGGTTLLCCGYEDGSVVLWDVQNESFLSVKTLFPNEPVFCVTLGFKNDSLLQGVAGSVGNQIAVFNYSADEQINVIKMENVQNEGISAVGLRHDCRLVCFGGWDHRLRVFAWKNMRPLATLTFHSDKIRCVEFCQETKLLAAGSDDKKISIWSIYR